MSYLAKVYDFLIRNNYSRDCVIFGIGGGITCDMTGFIASTFLLTHFTRKEQWAWR